MGDDQKSEVIPNEIIEVVLHDLETLLRGTLGNSLIVDSFTTKDLVPAGENYGSTILRVDAEVRRDGRNSASEELSLVAKMVPPTEIQRMMFDSPFTFRKEIYMFTDILPAFKALELRSGVLENELFDLLPKFYGARLSIDEPKDKFDHDAVILMENLKLKNYACCDRRTGVDLEHARLAIEALARFHALGIAVKLKQPQLFEEIKDRAKYIEFKEEIAVQLSQFIVSTVRKIPRLGPHVARIEKVLLRSITDFCSPEAPVEPWGSIVHTDLWINNIMFRDNARGNPEDVKFIDFQHYCYQNPLRDLVFFLFTSCTKDVRATHIEDLVDFYYDKFISHLARLKCDTNLFARDSFNKQFADMANLEYIHCATFVRVITIGSEPDPAGEVDPAVLFEAEANTECRERIAEISSRFINEDWI